MRTEGLTEQSVSWEAGAPACPGPPSSLRSGGWPTSSAGRTPSAASHHEQPVKTHIRERRYELELMQKEVAERADTSHSFASKLERGEHMPTIPVLKRILAVLDEELLIGVERRGGRDEDGEREVAPVPALVSQ